MKRRNKKCFYESVLYIASCFFIVSCGGNKEIGGTSEIEEVTVLNDLTGKAQYYADSLLVTMTLEERVGQCLMPSLYANTQPATLKLYKEYIEDYHIGGIVLMQGDLSSAKTLSQIGEESKIPLFIAIDAEWGLGMRLKDAPVYPKNGNIAKDSEDTELFDYGVKIAKECSQVGINMVLGPVVDISTRRQGVIGKRSFGSNPSLVSDFGVAYAKGLESGGVISVAKHFPGHGSTVADTHKGVAKIKETITSLDTIDLRPFREYINHGLTGVMAGHIQSLALDPSGRVASVSIDMLTSLLREEMGFNGLILTDAFDMGGARGFSATDALNAGADLILCPMDLKKEYLNILENVKNGNLDVQIVNTRCKRILFTKYLFSILPKG